MSACPGPSAAQLRASQLIGLITHVFSELESDVDDCLRAMTGSETLTSRRMLRSLSFVNKLDNVFGTLAERYAGDREQLVALRRWRRRFERFRLHRNELVHGLWDEGSQTIGAKGASEDGRRRARFNVHELSSELDALRQFRVGTLRDWFGGEGGPQRRAETNEPPY
jgi:hypothetical protein